MNRLERDRPSIKPVDRFSFKEVIRSASSPHVIMFYLMAFIHSTMSSGLNLYLPSIISQLGFSPNATQLLSAGPHAAGSFGEPDNCLKCDISPGFIHCLSFQLLYLPHFCRTVTNQEVLRQPLSPCLPLLGLLFT